MSELFYNENIMKRLSKWENFMQYFAMGNIFAACVILSKLSHAHGRIFIYFWIPYIIIVMILTAVISHYALKYRMNWLRQNIRQAGAIYGKSK